MIRITNGIREINVTKGAYKNFYKPQGWHESGKSLVFEETSDNEPQEELLIEDEFDENLNDELDEIETPFSEMTVKELHVFAKEHNIDVNKAKNRAEIIEIIESALKGD